MSEIRQTSPAWGVMLGGVMDDECCYRAVRSRDPRFDGWFFTAVVTTGIYCRPSCPARTPKRGNVRFFSSAAAAHGAGFRACKRCRPDTTPGSPMWNARADSVGRAMRLIADGVVDRDGVSVLARRLGYSERHLHRLLMAEVGAGPLALARAERAQTARVLLETTDLSITSVALAAGFASVRQFNATIQEVFAVTPSALRGVRRGREVPSEPATIGLCLPLRRPFDARALFAFLADRAVPGVEEGNAESYRRTLALPHGNGVVELAAAGPADAFVRCRVQLEDLRDLGAAVQRSRRLLDLDADPVAVAEQLGADPTLGPLVVERPGLRVPGHVDGDELAVRAVLGQQVSVATARTLAGRLVRQFGKPLSAPAGSLTHLFPTAAVLADLTTDDLPMPSPRAEALLGLCRALASGDVVLDPGSDRCATAERLLALPGIGAWTVAYIRMRALSDPDVFLPTDLGVRRALETRGLPADPRRADALATRWRPWRSYAVLHLWNQVAPR